MMTIWKKRKGLMFCTLALLVGVLAIGYARQQQLATVTVDIGPFPTQQGEERAALKRLSLELTRHPEARSVRIVAGPSRWRQGVMGFARLSHYGQKNVFWMDTRFSGPVISLKAGIQATVTVSEEPIHMAAHHLATFNDAEQYDEQLRSSKTARI